MKFPSSLTRWHVGFLVLMLLMLFAMFCFHLRDILWYHREGSLRIERSTVDEALLLAEIIEESKGKPIDSVEFRLFLRLHALCKGHTEPDWLQWDWYENNKHWIEWALPAPNVDNSAGISQLSLFHAQHPEIEVPPCTKAFLEH